MANSGVIIPSDIGKVIDERVSLWRQLDKARIEFGNMEKLSLTVASSTPRQIASELTHEKTPPAEIGAALRNLENEIVTITNAKEQLKASQDELAATRKFWIIAAIILTIIAIIGFLIIAGISLWILFVVFG